MDLVLEEFAKPSPLRRLLVHFSRIEDARQSHRVAYPLAEVLFLAVCGTIADCDDYEAIADWGEENLDFLRRFLPFHHGVPTGRWLTILMNRLNPALFSACFTAWVRETWPERRDFVAIDGKTSRRSHDRAAEMAPLHLVSAFATTRRLVLGQEAVRDKSNELTAIPALLERLARDGGLEGALVTIDAMGCNAAIAQAVRSAGADYLIAVKANQPTLMAEFDLFFGDAEKAALDCDVDVDKGHGRIETRRVEVARQAEWLDGGRRFPGEFRMPGAAAVVRVQSRAELKDRSRFETRYYIASRPLSAECAAKATRGHWGIENGLHWVLDVDFREDQSRLRKGHGAANMAVVRHFAFNLAQSAPEPARPPRALASPRAKPAQNPKRTSLRRRRKYAARNPARLLALLDLKAR